MAPSFTRSIPQRMSAPDPYITGLSAQTQHTLTLCAHRFDGYEYAHQTSKDPGELLQKLWQHVQSGTFHLKPEDNLAVNFYVHRSFRHQGFFAPQRTPAWYSVLFLYLHLYRQPLPTKLQREPGELEWQARAKGSAEAAAAEIRSLLTAPGPLS